MSFFRHLCVFLAFCLSSAAAHESLVRISISRSRLCRIGEFKGVSQNCPGPCPNIKRRWDVNRDNPALVVRRGERVALGTLRNNHVGGFGRWSIVKLEDMMSHTAHSRAAFRWECAGAGRRRCIDRNFTRDCSEDETGTYNSRTVTIPSIYSDGVYVLGWVWFGGLNEDRRTGSYGDYYDCSIVEVRGGASLEEQFTPKFLPEGPDSRNGKCLATVNRVGLCKREPCKRQEGSPFNGLAKFLLPASFESRVPKPLYSRHFRNPYHRLKPSVKIRGMTLWRLRGQHSLGEKLWEAGASWESRHPYLAVLKSTRFTVTCEPEGDVSRVIFYVNGVRAGSKADTVPPYSIAGDWKVRGVDFFAPWQVKFAGTVTVVSCKAVGKDGIAAWYSMEISAESM